MKLGNRTQRVPSKVKTRLTRNLEKREKLLNIVDGVSRKLAVLN